MREHLYRGKRIDNGEWVYGYFVEMTYPRYRALIITVISVDTDGSANISDILSWNIYEVDPETVSEYIGSTDKNGTKLFEGDIVKARSGFDEYIGVVKYYEQYSGFYVLVEDEFGAADLRLGCDHTIAVIGNKWDNADLLEGKNGY